MGQMRRQPGRIGHRIGMGFVLSVSVAQVLFGWE